MIDQQALDDARADHECNFLVGDLCRIEAERDEAHARFDRLDAGGRYLSPDDMEYLRRTADMSLAELESDCFPPTPYARAVMVTYRWWTETDFPGRSGDLVLMASVEWGVPEEEASEWFTDAFNGKHGDDAGLFVGPMTWLTELTAEPIPHPPTEVENLRAWVTAEAQRCWDLATRCHHWRLYRLREQVRRGE